MNVGDIKSIVAAYLGRNSTSDFSLNGVDTLLAAINAARRKAERAHDFRYSEINGQLDVASGGTSLAEAKLFGTATAVEIKRVETVLLPVSGGHMPIEFLTQDEFVERVRRHLGRAAYDSSKTLAQLGYVPASPLAHQNGQILTVIAPTAITYPITVQLNAVRFLAPYTSGTNTDFITDNGSDYLIWQSVLEANKFWRRFIPKQESNVDEESVRAMSDEALATLIQWDIEIARGTSTPPVPAPAKESKGK